MNSLNSDQSFGHGVPFCLIIKDSFKSAGLSLVNFSANKASYPQKVVCDFFTANFLSIDWSKNSFVKANNFSTRFFEIP